MRKCKEKECQRMIPTGRSITSFACQRLGLCRRHYHERFPERPMWDLPALRRGREGLLSYDDRRSLGRDAVTREEMDSALSHEEELEELIRQQDFYDQWIEYLAHWSEGGEDNETADND